MYRKYIRLFSSIKERILQERQSRLKSLPTTTSDRLRNFGIIAHIDAGKTTTTERMLYYAGAIPYPGEVHDGNTTMDFMSQERERGITIRSAAISFTWDDQQFNLIDTPGHIDFTAEVERSLRVLDGGIVILDGVSGVETQTETVWFQANKFNIPRISFVNKMDRQGASLQQTVDSMKSRLNVTPFVVQIPVGETDHFNSVIDLIAQQEIRYTEKTGTQIETYDVNRDHPFYKEMILARDQLLQTISLYDDKIADLYLEDSTDLLNQTLLHNAIRKALHSNPFRTSPLYVGSALKNRAIQPLMDAVNLYLPSPSEKQLIFDINKYQRKLDKSEKLCAYLYKIIQDQELGQLAFCRIYSGVLSQKTTYTNSSKNEPIKIGNVFRVRANRYVPIGEALAGDIVAVQTKQAIPGSTIIGTGDPQFVLQTLQLPQCVFFARLEYESGKDKSKIEAALQILAAEDDSLKIQNDQMQIVIGGLGELHLEIVVQRLKDDFGLNCSLQKMQVEYREGISQKGQIVQKFSETIKGRPLYLKINLIIEPNDSDKNELILDFQRGSEFDSAYKDYKEKQLKDQESGKYIRNPCKPHEVETITDDYGEEKVYSLESMPFPLFYQLEQNIMNALGRGFLLSLPMMGVRATLVDGAYTPKRTTDLAIGRTIQAVMKDISPLVRPLLMEPIMNIQISCPNNTVQPIMNDLLSARRGHIDELLEDQSRFGTANSGRTLIKGTIPLQETIGYSTRVRSQSQGEAYFTMQFKNYASVGGQKQEELLKLL